MIVSMKGLLKERSKLFAKMFLCHGSGAQPYSFYYYNINPKERHVELAANDNFKPFFLPKIDDKCHKICHLLQMRSDTG